VVAGLALAGVATLTLLGWLLVKALSNNHWSVAAVVNLVAIVVVLAVSGALLYRLLHRLFRDDRAEMGLPDTDAPRSAAQRAAITSRFAQTPAHFHTRGVTLDSAKPLELDEARVLCLEQAAWDTESLVPILEPFARGEGSVPLVILASQADDELLATLEINAKRGILPAFAVQAGETSLRHVAQATGGKLVRAGRQPKIKDVGRATAVRLDEGTVTVVGAGGVEVKVALATTG